MENRFLFRGKHNDDWLYGDLLQQHEPHPPEIYIEQNTKPGYPAGYHDIDPATLGQCTGLRNEDDALIFEGDIIRFALFDYNGADTQHIGVVYWCDGAFWIDCTETEGDDGIYLLCEIILQDPCLEVKGNKHENAELLGVKP